MAGVDQLAAVRAFVRTHVAAAGGDDETTSDLVQAVDELVCNVVGHGYEGRPGSIDIAFVETPDEIGFRIRDDAPAFDPTAYPEPDLDLPLAQRRLGGMGIHLARALTDGFDPNASSSSTSSRSGGRSTRSSRSAGGSRSR